MKKYPKYKNTNIEWLDQIPEHWEVKKFKFINAEVETGKRENSEKEEVLSIGGEHIQQSKFYLKNKRYVSLDFYNNYNKGRLKIGDTLLVKDGATIGKAMFVNSLPSVNMMLNEHVFRINYNKLLYYIIISSEVQKYFWMSNQSSAQESITLDTLNSLPILLPPLSEQKAIADYLDKKTSEIDQIIEAKKKLIALYNEEKSALINRAVTKGIDDKAKLKPSGIEWLGDIPQHWEVKKFRYLYSLNNNKSDKDLKKIALENIESKTGKLIDTNTEFAGTGIEFNKDDILFGKLRPYLAKVYLSDFHGEAVGDFYVFTPNLSEVNPIFSKYRILDYSFIDIVSSSTYGAKMPRANWDFISNLLFAIPPLKEQEKIVDYIEKNVSVIDKKVANAKRLIELMSEYRTTLISEVVTGKVKVV